MKERKFSITYAPSMVDISLAEIERSWTRRLNKQVTVKRQEDRSVVVKLKEVNNG